jgi:glyoxylase-like metal-dependent hydrolase (beta-lactamase superfamily II)
VYDFKKISEHIYRLEVTYTFMGPISYPVAVWMIRGQDGWALIDAGPPDTADLVVAAVTRITGGSGPRVIFLTHAHIDHSGGLGAIRMAWNTPIICHSEEAPFVTGEMDYSELKAHSLTFGIARYFFPRASGGLPVARTIQPGESAAGMAVIHLPGHTPGHIGFLHPEDRAMICGDAMMNIEGKLSPPYTFSTSDPETSRASMGRLGELDYKHLLPSHGDPILENGHLAMLDYLGMRMEDDFSGHR